MDAVNERILTAIAGHILKPDLVEEIVDQARTLYHASVGVDLAAVLEGYLCTEELTRAGIEPATL